MARVGVAAAAVVALALSACNTSVQGRAIRAPGDPGTSTSAATRSAHEPISAHDLLLRDGESTPLGEASPAPVGDSYYTSARPPECSAALLFVNSPLLPAGSTNHADSSYRFASPALYAESVNNYANDLNEHDVVWNGFSAVTKCLRDAVGVSPSGQSPPMRLSDFNIGDGVLVWALTRPEWTCDYGLVALPRVAALLSACDFKPGFPMAEWGAERRSQIAGATP